MSAVRVKNGSVSVDGKLGDAAWANAPVADDFRQRDPVEGGTPSDKLEVRFVYDDDALYVGTRVTTRDGRSIQAPIGRRDNIRQSEHILVSLDAYRDRRTAYTFGVTASGVRGDWFHSTDAQGDQDASFEPVWEASSHIEKDGWSAELRIPFSQLRFNAADIQHWGVNINHWIPSRNEDVYWVAVPKKGTGWASWFGRLEGIQGIKPSRRLELFPYASTESKLTGNRDRRNPFDDGRNFGTRVGGDMKMGLGPGLTLQATINPDFGQVEADPAEVNLSAFETTFSEKRPFFVEGSQLFRGAASYFYSRRIGGRPRGPVTGSYVDYPNASTILGAAKITGRLSNGASLGLLTAVTNRESAQTYDTVAKTFGSTVVGPLTGYAVGRVQKEFGKMGSTAGVILTAIERNIDSRDPLRTLLNRRAFSGGGDWNYRFAERMYNFSGGLGFSRIMGDSLAILNAQRSSARYFQRPDAKSYHLDPSRTSLTGYNGHLQLAKNSGKHWLGFLHAGFESPGLELNDVGRLGTADGLVGVAQIAYRETQPWKLFRDYGTQLTHETEFNYDRDRQFAAIRWDGFATFRNFWNLNMTAWHDFRAQDQRLTRGGPSMGYGWFNVGIISLSTSSAARTRWNGRVYYGKNEFGTPVNRISGGMSMRPSTRFQFSIDPNYLRSINPRQYVTSLGGGPAATFGRRYVFAFIDQSTFLTDLRMNFTVRPDMTIEMYAQPFAASGRYYDHGELDAARSRNLRNYGKDGTTISQNANGSYAVSDTKLLTNGAPTTFTLSNRDFNIRSLRSNLVMRWEYRPGSTLFVVWQQDRSGFEGHGRLVGFDDLFGAFSHVGNNFLAVKANFWIPAL